jgi:hypothetical protein
MAVAGDGEPGLRIGPYVPQPDAETRSTKGNGPAFGPDHDRQPFLGEGPRQPDSWDFDPEVELPNDAYRGIRRAGPPRPFIKVGVVVGLVIVAAIALIIALKPDDDTVHRADGDSPTPSVPGADQPISPDPSVTGIADTGPAVASAAPVIPVFEPLTFEAEGGPPSIKRRGADVETLVGASGGEVVRFVGGSGELEIRGVAFTDAGTYRIAVYYASAATGTAVISMPNVAPLTLGFAGGSGCCAAAAVEVALPAGHRTMTISSVTSGVAIDRVVITRSGQ